VPGYASCWSVVHARTWLVVCPSLGLVLSGRSAWLRVQGFASPLPLPCDTLLLPNPFNMCPLTQRVRGPGVPAEEWRHLVPLVAALFPVLPPRFNKAPPHF